MSAHDPTLDERIAQLEDRLGDREGAAEQIRLDNSIVPMVLQRTIALLRHDLELMRVVKAWADERRDWDIERDTFGAEAELLAAARRRR
jgi:hypothetical protein